MTRRRRVVVYVTREDPETAHDELLVVDRALPPSGGLEPGETIETAAARTVRAASGMAVRFIRELGDTAGSCFVQATPTAATPDEWEHGGSRCRWVRVRPDLEFAGDRAAFVHAIVRRRVIAYVTRERGGRTELLTIEAPKYPEEGVQVPAGRIDYWEDLEEGLRRELAEETGLTQVRVVRELPDFEASYQNPYENHAFHLAAEAQTPDVWEHHVHGTGADAGLVYHCRWLPLRADLPLWNEGDPMLRHLPI